MTMTNTFIKNFFSYKRPDGSATEQEWIDTFILPRLRGKHWVDGAGNIHLDLRADSTNRTLFVGHTDTVHHEAGRQVVRVDKSQTVRVHQSIPTNCLGADDGAGVLVLLAMIEMGVPAYYIFTRCEERGGVGASYLTKAHSDLLRQFDRAVAFDRKGVSSVITHQGWGRCCSDAFADALCDALTNDTLMYAPDDGGVYTDTAEFVSIIPECTNISVGYLNEHTTNESLDMNHLNALILQVIGVDWDSLPVERDPTYEEPKNVFDWDMKGGIHAGYTDYNSEVYKVLEYALDGDVDPLLYLVSEAINPHDPDEVYEQIWNASVPESLLFNCMRQVDYAMDDEQTTRALVDLHQSLMYEAHYYQ
jgi:hypothetical protein